MKKTLLIICCLLSLITYSKPKHQVHKHSSKPVIHHRHGPYKHHSQHRHNHHHRHNHYGSFISGAIVGGLVTSILTPSQPVIVTPSVTTIQQTKQVWVPGKWIITRDIHGNEIKTWQPGYYITVSL